MIFIFFLWLHSGRSLAVVVRGFGEVEVEEPWPARVSCFATSTESKNDVSPPPLDSIGRVRDRECSYLF